MPTHNEPYLGKIFLGKFLIISSIIVVTSIFIL